LERQVDVMPLQIITPYVNDAEIIKHKQAFWEHNIYYEKDSSGIGSDLMFQKMWNKFPEDDIFILHADMYEFEDNWIDKVINYANMFPDAGIIGCLLLYPAKNEDNKYYIQSAGGKFTEDGNPEHFGSGLVLENNSTFKQILEVDNGQYDCVREVAWTTFGGCYIRRQVIKTVGNFSPEYEWTYNRDVDYCLTARQAGFKIYQIPVRLFHHESRDNKIIKANNPAKLGAEMRNLKTLKTKWANTKFYKTLDKEIKIE
jgi:GT2 family glycosyltransferase